MLNRLARQWGLWRSLIIYYGQPWRRWQARRFYSQFIAPGDLCFDIGAHVGSRVSLWARMGARCVAVEPLPHCMRLLRRLFGDNPAITLVEAAIGDRAGRQILYLNPQNPTIATLSQSWIAAVQRRRDFAAITWDEEIDVAVTTLDALIAQHGLPTFCKIDVEGSELAVLAGLSQPISLVSLEYTPADMESALRCIERLCELGDYEFNWSTGESGRLRTESWLTPAAMLAILKGMGIDDPSGDLYARRQGSRR
ncbi:MAG: FkbM family methyltransferase [Caldilineaceae bacterium]|nr:FkbM family methyltransferase [Caldilineaceae bacterium]